MKPLCSKYSTSGLVLDTENPLNTKVQTRSGLPARLLAVDLKGNCPIAVAIEANGAEIVDFRLRDGTVSMSSLFTRIDYDIINVPETREVWLNVYPNNFNAAYSSRAKADDAADYAYSARLARIKVLVTEGQFDE